MIYSEVVPVLLAHYHIAYEDDGLRASFLCPFHAETSPSCSMEISSGRWFCHGCGRGGGFFRFIELSEETPEDAMRLHRRLRHMLIDDGAPVRVEPRSEEERFDYVSAFARMSKIDWALLSKKHDAYRYFVRKRGLSPYILSAFDARLSGSEEYPVAIPIMRAGEMVGYVRRYVGEDSEARRYLYNKDFRAKEALAYHRVGDNGPCLIVEGMMDYLKAAQFGARHVAAILSWQIKQSQVEWLRGRGVEEVVCALDDDVVGRKGCVLLAQYFVSRRFKYPGPPAKDIGDLGQHEFWYGYENAEVSG